MHTDQLVSDLYMINKNSVFFCCPQCFPFMFAIELIECPVILKSDL